MYFVNDVTLAMIGMIPYRFKTFVKEGTDRLFEMQHPSVQGGYELILEVIFTRKKISNRDYSSEKKINAA